MFESPEVTIKRIQNDTDDRYDDVESHVPSDIDTQNYYYVQVFAEDGESRFKKHIYFVCFADNKAEAEQKSQDHIESMGFDVDSSDFHYYQKNYKRDSRKMVASGKYI